MYSEPYTLRPESYTLFPTTCILNLENKAGYLIEGEAGAEEHNRHLQGEGFL